MRYTNIVQIVGFAIGLTAMAGCSNEDPPPSNSCIPGETAFCACAGGTEGVQTCAGDGTFGVCDCPDTGGDTSDIGEDSEPDVSNDPDATEEDAAEDPDVDDVQADADSSPDIDDVSDTDSDSELDVEDADTDAADIRDDVEDADTSDADTTDVPDDTTDTDTDTSDVDTDTDPSTTLGEECATARDCSRGEFCAAEDVCRLIEDFDCDGQSGVTCTDGGMMFCEDGVPTHHTPCGDESGTGGICVDNECQIIICASSVSEFYCTTLTHAEPCFSFMPPPAIDCEDGEVCYDGACVPDE